MTVFLLAIGTTTSQISEIVNSMKGFMDFCRDQKLGPIEGMEIISGSANPAKLQLQKVRELEQLAGIQGLSSDCNTLNNPVAQQDGLGNQQNHNHTMVNRGALSGSVEAALNFSNCQNQLTRQNSINSNSNSHQQEAISSLSNLNQISSSSGPCLQNLPESFPNLSQESGFAITHDSATTAEYKQGQYRESTTATMPFWPKCEWEWRWR